MNRTKSFISFNKELLFGEIGAILSAPLFAYIAFKMGYTQEAISGFAVGGAIFGAAVFWLGTRIYDKKKEKSFSGKGLASDLAYFTPVAFLLTLLVYYPTLFFLSLELLTYSGGIVSSVFLSQIIAFFLFLVAINAYRLILARFFGKVL